MRMLLGEPTNYQRQIDEVMQMSRSRFEKTLEERKKVQYMPDSDVLLQLKKAQSKKVPLRRRTSRLTSRSKSSVMSTFRKHKKGSGSDHKDSRERKKDILSFVIEAQKTQQRFAATQEERKIDFN